MLTDLTLETSSTSIRPKADYHHRGKIVELGNEMRVVLEETTRKSYGFDRSPLDSRSVRSPEHSAFSRSFSRFRCWRWALTLLCAFFVKKLMTTQQFVFWVSTTSSNGTGHSAILQRLRRESPGLGRRRSSERRKGGGGAQNNSRSGNDRGAAVHRNADQAVPRRCDEQASRKACKGTTSGTETTEEPGVCTHARQCLPSCTFHEDIEIIRK